MSVMHSLSGLVMALMITQGIQISHAQDGCAIQAGRLISIENSVDVQGNTSGHWKSNHSTNKLCHGKSIGVDSLNQGAISLVNDTPPWLDENAAITLRRKPEWT